jgi:predicted RNA-binding protein with RPS1 domain
MNNLVIEKQRTFMEDSCIRIEGKVEIDNVKHKFELETDEGGLIHIVGVDTFYYHRLVEEILEVDPDLDCFLG